MEYPTQRGVAGGRDLPPVDLPLPIGMSRLSGGSENSGCGCEGHMSPVMPSCTSPKPCVPSCDPCGEHSWGLNGYPLAMVYAPCQAFRNLYDLDTALVRGTLFSELDLPIETAGGVGRNGGCGCGRA